MKNISMLLLCCVLIYVSGDDESAPTPTRVLGPLFQNNLKKSLDKNIANVGSASAKAVGAITGGIQKEIQTVKQPIDVTVTKVVFAKCAGIKKLLGVSTEQLEKEKEEKGLEDLSLHYRTEQFNTIIKIKDAAASLQHARTYDSDERLIVFLHGFIQNPTSSNFNKMAETFFATGRLSWIALDASRYIKILYLRSSTYVRFIGEKLGETLAATLPHGQNPDHIHIIGHSLGAHISGFAGKKFYELTGKKVGRITGLDPAGPCFSDLEGDLRLKSTDAAFVDIIHTNVGVYGLDANIGHVDYYPNNGREQPNCVLQTCSHSIAVSMYEASVEHPKSFPAVRCKDWDAFKKGECDSEISYMGNAATPGTNGTYFLQTSGTYPYGLGIDGTKYKNTDGILKGIGNALLG